jgi:hypothetical protein
LRHLYRLRFLRMFKLKAQSLETLPSGSKSRTTRKDSCGSGDPANGIKERTDNLKNFNIVLK